MSLYYCTSIHILLHSHNLKRHYRFSLLLYLQTLSAPFTQHKISLQCLAVIVPPNTVCSIHTTQNIITTSLYYCTSKHILLISHITKCHYSVWLLLYHQTQSAAFTQHKISLQSRYYCTSNQSAAFTSSSYNALQPM